MFYLMPLVRSQHIIRQLKKSGAVSSATARSFEEAGIINPHQFVRVTKVLLRKGVIKQNADGKFYLA